LVSSTLLASLLCEVIIDRDGGSSGRRRGEEKRLVEGRSPRRREFTGGWRVRSER
jgi:hypothetical protein